MTLSGNILRHIWCHLTISALISALVWQYMTLYVYLYAHIRPYIKYIWVIYDISVRETKRLKGRTCAQKKLEKGYRRGRRRRRNSRVETLERLPPARYLPECFFFNIRLRTFSA